MGSFAKMFRTIIALVLLVNSLRLDINGQKEVKIKGSEIQDRFFIKPFLEILSNDDEDYNDNIIDSDENEEEYGWINDWSEVFNVENFGVLQEVSDVATDGVDVASASTDDGVTIPPWKYSWIFGMPVLGHLHELGLLGDKGAVSSGGSTVHVVRAAEPVGLGAASSRARGLIRSTLTVIKLHFQTIGKGHKGKDCH